ncbi:MAG: dihydrodipicolinate synthase family protein [Peptococcaceae bacterium]|nr:dihydrodipicolinate synthase family protein [Peptococcaceae bacterium]MDH7525061.1 dihydrodipicolinate synthase family protein [Peptococcaceae bacterium]
MDGLRIKGVIPPMLTPFKENGDVDYEKHARNMERWNEANLCGYLVLGSNSEAAYLTEEEKLEMVRITARRAKKGRLVIAGTGMESTRETIRLTNQVADLGAQAALVLTPFYYADKMNDEVLIRHFTEVADKAKIPILIYNVTKYTHVNISARAVGILSRHPNIIGMKDSSGDIPQLVKFLDAVPDSFNLMVGTASSWYPALTLGVKAGIHALANIAPNECALVQEAYDQGDDALARETYLRLFPVNAAVTGTYGVAGLKYAADLLGYEGGCVRSPLLPLKEDEKVRLKEVLAKAGLLD